MALGALDVVIIAFADARGDPALAGVLLAVLAASSMIGGLAYGMRARATAPGPQLAAILVAGSATLLLLGLPVSVLALAVLLVLAGLPIGVQWAATSLALDRACGGRGGAEAYTWLTAGNGAGGAAGSVAGGAAVEQWGVPTAFLLAAAGPACAAAVAMARRSTLTPSPTSAELG